MRKTGVKSPRFFRLPIAFRDEVCYTIAIRINKEMYTNEFL